jgi:hypothetical protein
MVTYGNLSIYSNICDQVSDYDTTFSHICAIQGNVKPSKGRF